MGTGVKAFIIYLNFFCQAVFICHAKIPVIVEECKEGKFETETACIENRTKCDFYKKGEEAIILNKTTYDDKLIVDFEIGNYNTCCHIEYKIELLVWEHADGINNTTGRNLHSKRRFVLNQCRETFSNTEYKKTASIVFNYVYKAWYLVRIWPLVKGGSRRPLKSKLSYFNSTFEKVILAEQIPTLNDIYSGEELSLVTNFSEPFKGVARHVNNTDVFEILVGTNYPKECKNGSKAFTQGFMCCKQGIQGYTNLVTCGGIKGITPGNYTVHLIIEDERCMGNTMWTEGSGGCKWRSNIELDVEPPSSPKAEPLESNVSLPFIIGAAIGLAIFVGAVSIYLYRRNWIQSPAPETPATPHKLKSNDLKVLLVYSHDCEPYMELMKTFREVLRERCSCEVYDCFDWVLFDEISTSPMEWMEMCLDANNMKIVLVATELSYLRQSAMLCHKRINFTKPHTFDNLFSFALKSITVGMCQNDYNRVFVVRFDGFTDEEYLYKYINPFLRFVFPQSIEELFEQICPGSKNRSDGTDTATMKTRLEELVKFKKHNPHYLRELIAGNEQIIASHYKMLNEIKVV